MQCECDSLMFGTYVYVLSLDFNRFVKNPASITIQMLVSSTISDGRLKRRHSWGVTEHKEILIFNTLALYAVD